MKLKESKKVVIVGGGGSAEQFLQLSLLPKEKNPLFGAEVWAINFVGHTIKCDKIVAMDYITRDNWPLHMLVELHKTQLPIISCAKPKDIALNVMEYPLKEVTEFFGGFQYFNTSVAYAVALAIFLGAEDIGLYGIDFTWPGEKNKAEEGRSCVEFWLGIAIERGIVISIPGTSTLLDTYNTRELYGYQHLKERKGE